MRYRPNDARQMERLLKIKVCGLRDPENMERVCLLGPDFVGYIFYPHSKRYVGARPDPALFRIPARPVRKVGVFVNEEMPSLLRIFESCRLDLVQLHGEEPPEYCLTLAEKGIPVIKAFDPVSIKATGKIAGYLENASYFLFDSRGQGYGGTGKQFNWDLLQEYTVPFPFILSGGIGPEDASRIRELDHAWLFGVDLNSRFESAPGMKRVDLLERFMEKIKKSKEDDF